MMLSESEITEVPVLFWDSASGGFSEPRNFPDKRIPIVPKVASYAVQYVIEIYRGR